MTVTTGHQLGADGQAEWISRLVERFGPEINIKFDVDADLLAGAIVTFPHAILRFNWRDSLAVALKELHSNEHTD